MSLWDELTRGPTLRRPIWELEESVYRRSSYGDLLEGARHAAAGLRRRGMKPREVVPAVITNGPDAARGVAGVWFAGGTIASLPIPARGMTGANYVAQLKKLCASLGADRLLGDERLLSLVRDSDGLGIDLIEYRSLIRTEDRLDIEPPSLENTLFIQFSSGTTGEPRGVALTGEAIERQIRALADRESIDPDHDVGGTWLPMSHDMGFFGSFLTRWYTGTAAFRSTPERFLQNPQSWLDDCAAFGATLTAVPPFALGLAARAERLRVSGTKLALRLCVVGAERIDWSVLTSAAAVLGPRGLGLRVLTPGYGLAEATLAVTLADLDVPPRYIDLSAEETGEGVARRVVSCGTPLEGMGVRIDDERGEIVVSGPTLASGYHRNPEATKARFRDGELWTGDIGVLRDGELYVLGRGDDVLIVGGRNVHAAHVEATLGAERGVRKGNCAVVDIPGESGTSVALVAELDGDGVDTRELSVRLGRASMESAGLPIDRFVFLSKGRFPKTPSGKLQRYRCRAIAQRPDFASQIVDLGVRPVA